MLAWWITLFHRFVIFIPVFRSHSNNVIEQAYTLTASWCTVLFFSRRQSERWLTIHGRTSSIYPCPLSFWLTLPRTVLSTSWCCPSRPCVAFLACVHLALFLALGRFVLGVFWPDTAGYGGRLATARARSTVCDRVGVRAREDGCYRTMIFMSCNIWWSLPIHSRMCRIGLYTHTRLLLQLLLDCRLIYSDGQITIWVVLMSRFEL